MIVSASLYPWPEIDYRLFFNVPDSGESFKEKGDQNKNSAASTTGRGWDKEGVISVVWCKLN